MLKVNVNKAAPIDPATGRGACQSVTIVIDKEWKGPEVPAMPGELFYKTLDREFNNQAAQIAEALQNSLPGGTWDRLVGIMNRRHASYLIVNHEEFDKRET